MNVLHFQRMHEQRQKISMVTCYDYWTARILAKSEVDCLLVGDSVAMVMHGHPTTVNATMDMMVMHTEAVARGAPQHFIIADLPFLSYRQGLSVAMENIQRLMQAGAHAIKLEGVQGNEMLIEHAVQSGVPIMGHLGLTPQSVHQLGGFKVQGRDEKKAGALLEEAKTLEALGCFATVLECIPHTLAHLITTTLSIPTIGIGAGEKTSGQVLVLQDLLGVDPELQLKFLKKYHDTHTPILKAVNEYTREVKAASFPHSEHYYE